MATAYEIVHELASTSEPKLCVCRKSERRPGELSYPEPQNILSLEPPVPQPTCE